MNRYLLAALMILACFSTAASQEMTDHGRIRELVSRLGKGDTDAVKAALPDLIARYQNDPGVIYLQARVATDGIEAAKLYQSILDNFPQSEWADDALHSLYQYYYAMGLYKTADLKLQQLRKEYPQSEYLGRQTPPEISPAALDAGKTDTTAAPPRPGAAAGDRAAPADEGRETRVTPGVSETPRQIDSSRYTPAETLPYTVQVGAFSTSENAQKQKVFFEEFGYTAEITNRVRGGRSLYLVWVGSFATRDEARRTLREIESKYNITPIVVER